MSREASQGDLELLPFPPLSTQFLKWGCHSEMCHCLWLQHQYFGSETALGENQATEQRPLNPSQRNTLFATVWRSSSPRVLSKRMVIVVQLLSHLWLFMAPWTVACQASLSFTISWSLLKLMSIIESVMPPNLLVFCCLLFLLPLILPSIRVFSNDWLFASGGQSIGASGSKRVKAVVKGNC